MVSILIVGAGKSASYVIEYALLNTNKKKQVWNVTIADSDEATLKHKVRNYPNANIAVLDIANEKERQKLVKAADIVVSLMPPQLHTLLAKDCLQFKKNLITSSYASDEMQSLHKNAQEAGLMFMCEMGLDPGIDHMTASSIFEAVHKVLSEVKSFKSYCGGLIAPESDDNPWHYKFSWNPKNVINAGKDGAKFRKNGKVTVQNYEQLFTNNNVIHCNGVGDLAYYANRDSMHYIDTYNLDEASDFMRATLRHPDFCKGWDALITMGLTDTSRNFDTDNLSYDTWIKEFIGYDDTNVDIETFTWNKYKIKDLKVRKMIQWLNFFDSKKMLPGNKTPGDILLDILIDKWQMQPEDKDMVVMQHEIEYCNKGVCNKLVSSMVVKGENSEFSAMAKTVGTPMYILTELLANKIIVPPTGVLIPTMPQVYRPIINRLEKYGIVFEETVKS